MEGWFNMNLYTYHLTPRTFSTDSIARQRRRTPTTLPGLDINHFILAAATGTATQEASHFSNLPSELIEILAACLPKRTLLDFRRCSRHVESSTRRVFAKAWFSHRSVLASYAASVKKVQTLAGHSGFGGYLHTLTIDMYNHEPSLESWWKRRGIVPLRQLFCQLARTGREYEIEIVCKGLPNHYRMDSPWRHGPTADTPEPFIVLCLWLQQSKLKVTRLSLDTVDSMWSLAIHAIGRKEKYLSTFSQTMQLITSLTLDIWAPSNLSMLFIDSPDFARAKTFLLTVAQLPALRHLAISTRRKTARCMVAFDRHGASCCDDGVFIVLGRICFPHLKTLTLRHFFLILEDLIDFVELQTSLQQLALRGCQITGLEDAIKAASWEEDLMDDDATAKSAAPEFDEDYVIYGEADNGATGEDEEEVVDHDDAAWANFRDDIVDGEFPPGCYNQRRILRALREVTGMDGFILDPGERSMA